MKLPDPSVATSKFHEFQRRLVELCTAIAPSASAQPDVTLGQALAMAEAQLAAALTRLDLLGPHAADDFGLPPQVLPLVAEDVAATDAPVTGLPSPPTAIEPDGAGKAPSPPASTPEPFFSKPALSIATMKPDVVPRKNLNALVSR